MRAFVPSLAALLALGEGSVVLQKPRGDPDDGSCKAFPGTSAWPSDETWAGFNDSINGKLITPGPPPAAVCHPKEASYNSDQCAVVSAAWPTYEFHDDSPVSNMWQQYNNDTCVIDPDAPCSAAGYPAYVVNATTATDVKLSLEFARKHDIRVIVKSSGHDYQGRSQAPGALSIWLRYMNSLETHDTFTPTGCNFSIDSPAVTVGGGSQLGFIYETLDKINRTIVGGTSKSVSVGGYLTGGGHSILSPLYGMGADNVLEMEVVTPMGDIVIANECQNEDLFWAMRGGGGSTFGVMTSVTLATHPTPKIVAGVIGIFSQDFEAPWIWDAIGYILSQSPYLDSKNVSGYAFYSGNLTLPEFKNGTVGLPGLGGVFAHLNSQDPNEMQAIWNPILAHVKAEWPEADVTVEIIPFPSYQSWFSVFYDNNIAGIDQYIGSRLFDEEAFKTNSTALGAAVKDTTGAAFLVAGNGTRNAKPRGGGTSVTPTWRRAIAHMVSTTYFAPLNTTAREWAYDTTNTITEPLRQFAPDMGAYINENFPGEPDWQRTYWGDNYDRLLQIKREVDPDDVLWCHPCVGNDGWKQSGYRLCRAHDNK